MKASKLVTIVALVGLASMAAGGAATGWLLHTRGSPRPDSKSVEIDTRAYKYINLEKVVVMLRSGTGTPDPHYLALDLVFKTPTDSEGVTREHLPLLRSVAVRALSNLTLQSASTLTIEELSRQINEAYSQTYAHDRAGPPFVEAMIGKLIIE